jgi:hypothetical protein
MVAITDAVARPTVRGTRRYPHTRTPLMRVRVCGWLRVSSAVAGAATEVPRAVAGGLQGADRSGAVGNAAARGTRQQDQRKHRFPKPGVAGSIPAGGTKNACSGRFSIVRRSHETSETAELPTFCRRDRMLQLGTKKHRASRQPGCRGGTPLNATGSVMGSDAFDRFRRQYEDRLPRVARPHWLTSRARRSAPPPLPASPGAVAVLTERRF